jgi:Tfp pilus assembly protein PilF
MKFLVVGSRLFHPQRSVSIGRGSTVQKKLSWWIPVVATFLVLSFCPLISGQQNPGPGALRSFQNPAALAEAQAALERGDASRAIAILLNYLQAHPKDISARLALGQAYVSAGDNERARAEFQNVLKESPNNIPALASAGEIYLHDGQLDKAELMLERAVKAGSNNKRVRMEWAAVLVRLHKYAAAESALRNVTPPTTPEELISFQRLKASIASGLGNSSSAAAEMEKALALRPHDAGLAMATATAELQSQDWRRAASLAQNVFERTHEVQAGIILLEAQLAVKADFHGTLESLRATPWKPDEELLVRQKLAEVLISHGEFAASVEELKRAVELDPKRADLTYNLALAQFKAGFFDDARRSADKCKALEDTADLEDLLGDISEATGDSLTAVRSYQAAVALAPNDEKYRLALAVEFIRHKSFEPARVVIKQAEELWPQSWRIQLASAMIEYFAGSEEDASRILAHAAELLPEPEMPLRYLGNIQMEQASPPTPAAISQLCRYSDQHPRDGMLQYYCGGLMFRRDYLTADNTHAEEIEGHLHMAANLLDRDPAPHCQLGKLYRWLERWKEAQLECETCVRMDPNSTDGHYRLAQIYQHLGQRERSRQEMELYRAASQRVADENARRDETMKTFLYTIQK